MSVSEYVIGLDLGTKCGWSVLDLNGNRVDSGHWNFQPKRFESAGIRYIKFAKELRTLIAKYSDCKVGFEAVHRHRWGKNGWTTKSDDEADALWVASTFIKELF